MMTIRCIVHTWVSCKETCLKYFRISFYVLNWVINICLYVNSEETGMAEEELASIQNQDF